MDFRLFYSDFITTFPSGSAPALSAEPSVTRVTAAITGSNDIAFSTSVTGDPAAGIQTVWVT